MSNADRSPAGQIAEYVRTHPDADPVEVLGALELAPEYRDAVEDALGNAEFNQHRGRDTGGVLVKTESADNRREEPDSPRPNPGGNPDASRSATPGDAADALADAVEWYHRQLDRDLPEDVPHDTPRDYYRDARGWTPDTIAEKRVGYAPPNPRDELLAHLHRRGHDRDAILGTGLFGERDDGGLYTLWSGRYVLPYLDADGRPVFAISRRLDPPHPADYAGRYGDGDPAKYHKIPVSRDAVAVEEPIYGLDTVRAGEPVLITEGIADAITAHQAGYPCLSPVTTTFKTADRERLVDALDRADVPRVYIIQDAERPGSDLDDRGRLTVPQYGEGVRGAVRTAEFLAAHGFDARVGDLPRPGLSKVDLDDYLTAWDGDLRPVLATATPPAAHDAGAGATTTTDTPDTDDHDGAERESEGEQSAVFDLDIADVTGEREGYRGKNPLGHHGDSEDYFTVYKTPTGDLRGADHKHGVTYTALTYLLADATASSRSPARPGGALDDGEILTAWVHAKDRGDLGDDDPIPRRALQAVAREATEWDGDTVEHTTRDGDTFDGLPVDIYNAALDAVRDQYGVDPGREPVGDGALLDTDPQAVLPPAVRDLSTAASGWDWKHAGRRDAEDTDPIQKARDRTTEEIVDALESFDHALVEALPTLGKSYGTVKAVDDTGEPATILTGRGNVEQYDRYKKWADEFGLDVYTLPAFTRDCPTANGEHGEDWKETVGDWYRRGATPQAIHAHAEYHLGEPLPCQRHDGQECPYSSAWRFDPDDYDILLGHYTHAYNQSEKVTVDRAVLVDEFPGDAFERGLGGGILKGAVTHYLQARDAIPYDDHTDLIENRDDDARRADALAALTDGDALDPDTDAVFRDSAAHADAPLAVFTILAAAGEDLGNGLERAPFPGDDDRVGLFDRAGDVFTLGDDPGDVRVLDPPPLDYARSVVALDGTPTPEMWELSLGAGGDGPLGERMTHRRVLPDDERREYLREHLNLNIVRTTEYVKPYNSADHVAVDRDMALLEAIREKHGQAPGLITTRTALDEYDAAGALDLERDDTGRYTGEVLAGPADRVKWRGDVLGSNEFDDVRLGAVVGSNHYGDGYIKKWGAYAGEAVEREAVDPDAPAKGENLTYGPLGDRIHRHMTEHDTLQAVMRFGRDGNGAVVYSHTDTLPEWVDPDDPDDDGILAGEGRVVDTRDPGERQVLDAAEDLAEWSTAEIAAHPAVEIGDRQVFNILQDLADRGVLDRERDGRGYRWTDDGLETVSEYGEVDLGDADDLLDATGCETVQEMARTSTYTWNFPNLAPGPSRDTLAGATNGGETAGRPVEGADRPPDPGD